jgi:hypothetical protein
MADAFGVSHANIGYIVRREAWRDVASEADGPASPRRPHDGAQLEV